MTYFVALFVLWATGQLTWYYVGISLGVVYVARRALQLLFTRWMPTAMVADLVSEKETEVEARFAPDIQERDEAIEALRAELRRLRLRVDEDEGTIDRLRFEVRMLRDREKGNRKEAPRKPSPKRPATWWEVLGVDAGSSGDAVETAYRNLARRFHPDRPEGNLARMQEINAAMDVYRKLAKA